MNPEFVNDNKDGGKDKKPVSVYLDGEEKSIPRGKHTTEELLSALGVEAGYLLNVVNDEGQLVILEPGQEVHVKKDMKFISQVPCGYAA